MKNLPHSILLGFFLIIWSTIFAFAQPGPLNVQVNYDYTILDENNEPISFATNSKYHVNVDCNQCNEQRLYLERNINGYSHPPRAIISINDKEIVTGIPGNINRPITIQVIHRKDTMFLNQQYGRRILKFIPGYYYFPDWSDRLLISPPILEGNAEIKNLDQKNFLVTKEEFYEDRNFEETRVFDNKIADRFIKGNYVVNKSIDTTKTDVSFAPFKSRGFMSLYPLGSENLYIGNIEYDVSQLNYFRSNHAVAILNTNENSIAFKTPKKKIDLFYTNELFADTINHVFYQAVGTRDTLMEPSCEHSGTGICAYTKAVLKSKDEGETWEKDENLTALFNRYDYFQMHFLDKEHAVISIRYEKYVEMKGRYKQAVYYILKNGIITDSIKSEQYFENSADFQNIPVPLNTDTLVLGLWSIEKVVNVSKQYTSAMVIKQNDVWKLVTTPYNYEHSTSKNHKEPIVKPCRNFSIDDKNKLTFAEGSIQFPGQQKMYTQPTRDNDSFVLEFDNQIFVIDIHSKCTWFSVDTGKSWYLYPKPLDSRFGNFMFIEMNDKILSVYNGNNLTKSNYEFIVK